MDRRLLASALTPLLPPLALYVTGDAKPRDIAISAVLCLLFWVPGAIYAFVMLQRA